MRPLKYHEQKLLKKVDFLHFPNENTLREASVMRQFHIQKRDDYMKYRRLVASLKKLADYLSELPAEDNFRIGLTEQLLDKLYSIGLINRKKNLETIVKKLTVSCFCKRRFPVVLVRLKFSQTLREATSFIEAGHLRVGPEIITDPAFLVTREMEDYITWTDSSRIKRHIKKFNNQLDDFDLLFA